ncbi:bacterial proteasome activator family protein [Knoellia locipacati]|uniref:Bacterial proteasome activator n=1 Tax=Knoellia locipacati TaxID=882824 RepID=A0A512SYF1_9MICO|nr:proteasome activator [Knoellia locipacati]GEQ12956.1 bacterial proteasome activator [Knoellia locipacati]
MSQTPQQPETPESAEEPREVHGTATVSDDKVVVVTPEGMGVAHREEGRASQNPADLVEQPAKVMRIGSMIKQLLEEVRNAPLDEKGRARLADVHERSIAELKDGLAPELVEELERIALPFSDEAPSDAELRVAQAQLVGWLEGLFHGIQTALVAQQMAAQAQLQQMRQLPPGHTVEPGHPAASGGPVGMPTMPGGPSRPADTGPAEGTGQYL